MGQWVFCVSTCLPDPPLLGGGPDSLTLSPNATLLLLCRFSVGKRFLAGSIGLPTSAPVSLFSRVASRRSGSHPRPCSPASARSSRTNWRKRRTLQPRLPWPAPPQAPDLGATPNYKCLQSHTFRTGCGSWLSLEKSERINVLWIFCMQRWLSPKSQFFSSGLYL